MQRLELKPTHKPVQAYYSALRQFDELGVTCGTAVCSVAALFHAFNPEASARLSRACDAEEATTSGLHTRWVHEALPSGKPTPLTAAQIDRDFAGGIARAAVRLALLLSAGLLVEGLAGCCTHPPAAPKKTFSSFDLPAHRSAKPDVPGGMLDFQNAELRQVLAIYQELSGRTVIRPASLPAPTITVRNQNPLNRVQALQLLDTVLAENGIAMVLAGDNAVKAVPHAVAVTESPPEITLPWQDLPDSGSFMMRTVHLKRLKAAELVPALMPFAKTPNALLPISTGNQLIIRDYSSNVRRMLQVIQELEKDTKP